MNDFIADFSPESKPFEPSADAVSKAETPESIQKDSRILTLEKIKNELGDLENIRLTLGLSQRKMSQLLLVDPSAWNRWVKHPEQIPPLIYRALSWFLALRDKYPHLKDEFWLGSIIQGVTASNAAFTRQGRNNLKSNDDNQPGLSGDVHQLNEDYQQLKLRLAHLETELVIQKNLLLEQQLKQLESEKTAIRLTANEDSKDQELIKYQNKSLSMLKSVFVAALSAICAVAVLFLIRLYFV